jgi:hypothetical protein
MLLVQLCFEKGQGTIGIYSHAQVLNKIPLLS